MSNFKDEFLKTLVPLARTDHYYTQVPAEVTIGQAILESSWGRSKLTTLANNLFGIKADNGWEGPTVHLEGYEYIHGSTVHEMMSWRKYDNWAASVADHSAFLHHPRYKAAFETSNWQDFVKEIAKAGYATDPTYANQVINIVESSNIEEYLKS